jgi:predicted nucleic-acid-binding Zn-ribbon protein
MADPLCQLAQDYACPKCRSRQAHAREIVLPKQTGLLNLLPSKDNRYIEVTCTLCGYTEFYNRSVYLKSCAIAESREKIPLPENAKGG